MKCAIVGVRIIFFRGEGQHQHFVDIFQVADDALQLDVYKTLYTFDTTNKMPYVMAPITKNTLRWQQ